MASFPEPPGRAALQAVGAELRFMSAGRLLWRVYFRAGAHPTTWNRLRAFGPTQARFDHHTRPRRAQRRAVTYLAASGVTCLAEVFQQTRVIDRIRGTPWLVGFELGRQVALLDLTAGWPTRAGASMALCAGSPARARRWARAIYRTWPEVEGLYYGSAMHAKAPASALWQRAADALPAVPVFHRALSDPALLTPLRNAARELNYGLV